MIVLIVDDEPDLRDTLRDVLEEEGYRVAVASHGGEAMALLADPEIGVVVLDLMMPIMDGGEVIRAMRADPRLAAIPIIVITSDLGRAPDGVRALQKPIDLDRLLGLIAAAARAPGEAPP